MHSVYRTVPVYAFVHGSVFTAWFVWLVVQTSLVAAGRSDVHRRLGATGAAIGMAVFVSFVAAAVLLRRHLEIHKRLMLFASIPLVGAALSRLTDLTGISGLQGALILLALPVLHDILTRRWPHPVTLICVSVILARPFLVVPAIESSRCGEAVVRALV